MNDSRRQFRHRRRAPANLNPKPALSAELRAKYLEPIVPWQMANVPLSVFDGHVYGLLGSNDLAGYAAHFEVGVPWFTTQSPWLIAIAPPWPWSPFHHAQHHNVKADGTPRGVRGWTLEYKRAMERRAAAKPAIATLDRIVLREKYQQIAAQYLAGNFRGYHSTRFSTASTLLRVTNGANGSDRSE